MPILVRTHDPFLLSLIPYTQTVNTLLTDIFKCVKNIEPQNI